MARKFYIIEHRFQYGWDDAAWQNGEKPWEFETPEAALQEIKDLCSAMNYDPKEYRVIEKHSVFDNLVDEEDSNDTTD